MLSFIFIPALAQAATSHSVKQEYSEASLLSSVETIAAGKPFYIAAKITLLPGWHTYTEDPGDAGIPTSIDWKLPKGFNAGPIEWPPFETHKEGTLTTYGYLDTVTLPVKITPPDTLAAGEYTFTAKVDYLTCKDICIPQSATLTLKINKGSGTASSHNAHIDEVLKTISTKQPSFAGNAGTSSLSVALLFAVLGGLILNLMPCVFPVLSLKALAVARQSSLSKHEMRMEGIAYTLGILLCFAAIAAVLLGLKSAGGAVGWGYQMQSSAFVGFLIYLLFLIALNMSGFFDLPVLFGNVGLSLTQEPTAKGSFFTGVLATLVATPCTAPFMAAAVGYALTLPSGIALLIFLALGFGLALPFLLLSFCPSLVSFLPKPGAWMETFKQLLAFPMYASVIWLLWVITSQLGASGVVVALTGMLSLAFVIWLQKRLSAEHVIYRYVSLLLVILITAISLKSLHTLNAQNSANISTSPLAAHGIPYSADKLATLRAQGKPVFVDATATWCITCQLNYKTTLSGDTVQNAFKEKGITFMVADWTRADPEITKLLNSFGYSGVPLYAYYPVNGEPKILPQLLTPKIVLEALE